jgi:Secretion system C-terminal sorting domain
MPFITLTAQTTYIPDDNFEQALIDLGYDTVLDDFVLTANINSVTSLNVAVLGIADLTGIEDFTALEELICFGNQLTSLDLSQNIALTELYCNANQLTSLDVSQNTGLITLISYYNQLTSLDVTQNTLLTELSCFGNQLTSLDVTQNTALTSLICYDNQLTSLDLTQNTALTSLKCNDNQLTNLDVTQNTALTELVLSRNQLTSLNLTQNTVLVLIICNDNQLTNLNIKNGNNFNVTLFNATSNPSLTCIEVDDAAWSTANWTEIDPASSFSEDCNLGIDDFEQNSILIYPNPAKNHFMINTTLPLFEVVIYTLGGKMVSKQKKNEKYDVFNLKSGVYFVRVTSNSKTFFQKLLID